MTDLVEFLRAALDEDERVARAATPGPWRWEEPSDSEWPTYDQSLVSDGKADGGEPAAVLLGWGHDASGIEAEQADRDHIARHDPARVLAEVAAKRAILDRYEALLAYAARPYDDHPDPSRRAGYLHALQVVIEGLAQPYAGRPGWREEWAT
jgi:hypothetical protein